MFFVWFVVIISLLKEQNGKIQLPCHYGFRLDFEPDDTLAQDLAAQGYIPTKVSEKKSAVSDAQLRGILYFLSPVKSPELILFTKQFNTLIRAGVPMLSLLSVLQEQTEHAGLRRILGTIHQDIKEGASLYEAFSRHPKVFSPLYCDMLRAGEAV